MQLTNSNNIYAVILASWIFVGIGVVLVMGEINPIANIIFLMGGVIFIVKDREALKKTQSPSPHFGWILFFPGYLISRAIKTKDSVSKILGFFVTGLLVFFLIFIFFTTGGGTGQWVIASESINITSHKKAYCRSIDNIESESNRTTHCVKVLNVTKVEDNVYRVIALMSNGSTYRFAAVWSDDFSYNLYYLTQEHKHGRV